MCEGIKVVHFNPIGLVHLIVINNEQGGLHIHAEES